VTVGRTLHRESGAVVSGNETQVSAAQGPAAAGAPGAPATSPAPAAPPSPAQPPSAPSAPPAESRAPSAPEAPPEDARHPARSWLSRLLRGESRESPAPASPPDGAAPSAPSPPADATAGHRDGPSTATDGTPAAPAEATEPETPWTPPASKEEEARRIQAEVDRRAARAARQAQQQGNLTRAQQAALLAQQEREARETDVYKAAELRNQLDALAAQEQFVAGMAQLWDQFAVGPVAKRLPQAVHQRFTAEAPDGPEGRGYVVEQSLRWLEQHWRQEEREKLKKSPAVRKQLLAEMRRGELGDDLAPDEPELLGGRATGRPATPNDWFRQVLTSR
jgi:hypothetical protein